MEERCFVKVINSEIGCIVLAAGESSRLGHPKALIEVGGETLVSWVSRRLTELGLSPVIVTRNELYQKVKDSVCLLYTSPSPRDY